MSREKITEITRAVIEEAQSDVVGLWAVLWEVKNELPSLSTDEAKAATLEIVRDALRREEIVAGEFGEGDAETTAFIPWQTPAPDTLSTHRIRVGRAGT